MKLEEIKREDLCQIGKGRREMSWRDVGLEQGTDMDDVDMNHQCGWLWGA